jgi:hypothetical protein
LQQYPHTEGGEAYLKELPNAEIHRLDSGHFAVEDCLDEIDKATILREWPKRQLDKNSETIGNIQHMYIYTMQHSGYGSDELRLLPTLTNSASYWQEIFLENLETRNKNPNYLVSKFRECFINWQYPTNYENKRC